MDNYDLSNLPLLGHSEDSGERHPWLTDEQSRRATFARRTETVTTSEQAELRGSSGDEQIPKQKALADFDISLASDIFDPLVADESVVDEPENPFALLAAYQPLTFEEDDPQCSHASEMFFFEGFCAKSLPDVELAEPEKNDFLEPPVQPEQPNQSQGEPNAKGMCIPETAYPETISDKRQGYRRRSERRHVILTEMSKSSMGESIAEHFEESLHKKSARLSQKRPKLDSTETEIFSSALAAVTRSQTVAMPENSANSEQNTEQNPDESFEERLERETAKWIERLPPRRGIKYRFRCSYPDCDKACNKISHLKSHIFMHIHISKFKCTEPECGGRFYFRNNTDLQRHVLSVHAKQKPHSCELCKKSFARSDHYKRHIKKMHKTAK